MTPLHITSSTGSTLIAALEAAFAVVRRQVPDLPDVVFITGTAIDGRGARWGHYRRDAWVKALSTGRRPELFIAGERFECGAEDTFATMLHEAAHALAVVRGLDDTSQSGRYHNGRFLALAEELGLTFKHETPHAQHGYSDCSLTAETATAYRDTIVRLGTAIRLTLDTFKGLSVGGAGGGSPRPPRAPRKSPDRNNVKATCSCLPARVIRVSRSVLDGPAIVCEACEQNFTTEVAR
jgi:hypothetical protein